MIKMENWVLQKYYVMRFFCIAKRSVILFTWLNIFFYIDRNKFYKNNEAETGKK